MNLIKGAAHPDNKPLRGGSVTPLILSVLFLGGCTSGSDQVDIMIRGFFAGMLFFVPFVTGIIVVIFLMNRFIKKDGVTHKGRCAVVGILFFTPLFLYVLGRKFGTGLIPVIIYVVLGLLIGGFSYMIDELIISFWELRKKTIPALLGENLGVR